MDPLAAWEAYFAETSDRMPGPSEGLAPSSGTWSSAAVFIAQSPYAPLLRALAATVPHSFSSQ
eukprot:5358494-Prymnesium_polylepis.1